MTYFPGGGIHSWNDTNDDWNAAAMTGTVTDRPGQTNFISAIQVQ